MSIFFKRPAAALVSAALLLGFGVRASAQAYSLGNFSAPAELSSFGELPVLAEKPDCSAAKSAILAELGTGQVLCGYNADLRLPAASLTKIMTLLIAAREISGGRLSLDGTAKCSDYAASMGGSVIWLEAGEEMEIGELIKSVAIASSNDACVMLAERIEGSEAAFVERMNKTAAELGMNDTRFVNCTGLDAEGQYSTARDIVKMAGELRKYSYFDGFLLTRLDSVRTGTRRETQLLNTNKLAASYSGMTGLKAGADDKAGFCCCATAKRSGMELAAVVLGCSREEGCFDTAKKLLDYGFSGFETVSVRPDPSELSEVEVSGGVKKTVDTRYSGTTDVILPKGSADGIKYHYSRSAAVSAPVEKGQLLGFVTVTSGDTVIATVRVVAAEEVEELDFGRCVRELLKKLFTF